MTECKEIENPSDFKDIEREILRFLESRGRIKAALLHKLENHFCSPKIKFNLSKDVLHCCIFKMFRERTIEIIIPELFKEKFRPRALHNLKYLKDGIYFTRRYVKFKSKYLNDYKLNDYYLDSRDIKLTNNRLIENWIDHLKLIVRKVKDINKKIIILYPKNSNRINIYENIFEGKFHLSNIPFSVEKKRCDKKLEIPLEKQAFNLAIIQAYRKKFACFYIPLISSILKKIEYIQENKEKIGSYEEILWNYTLKFAYACIQFVKSDYIEIEGNPLRWESFFNYFNIPIKVLTYDFKSIQFYGKTFENYQILKICIYIDKKYSDIIKKLKSLGYEEFSDENYENFIAIGLSVEIYYPCSTIEHIYFLSKYLCFYCLFLLFSHSFEYLQKIKPKIKFTNKEKAIYNNFLPVIDTLFDVHGDKIPKKLIFKYYTYNPDELEVIYNHFLIDAVKDIEKKMYKYFRFRSTLR